MTTPLSLFWFVLQVVRDVGAHGLRECLANGVWVATQAFSFVVLGGLSFYAANLAIAVLIVGLTQAAQPATPVDKQTLFQALLGVVWLMYFRTSSDVAGTFINE